MSPHWGRTPHRAAQRCKHNHRTCNRAISRPWRQVADSWQVAISSNVFNERQKTNSRKNADMRNSIEWSTLNTHWHHYTGDIASWPCRSPSFTPSRAGEETFRFFPCFKHIYVHFKSHGCMGITLTIQGLCLEHTTCRKCDAALALFLVRILNIKVLSQHTGQEKRTIWRMKTSRYLFLKFHPTTEWRWSESHFQATTSGCLFIVSLP